MYSVSLPQPTIAVTIFGIQIPKTNPGTASTPTVALTTLDTLLSNHPTHTQPLVQDGPITPEATYTTHIRLTYWATPSHFTEWWESPAVSTFWRTLPPTAGIYRETLQIPTPKTQIGTNKLTKNGQGHLASYAGTDKMGYWGCYYDRMSGVGRANKGNHVSPLKTAPCRRESTGTLRPGRVAVTRLPENLCFVVEGQDHSDVSAAEKDYWFAHFDGPVKRWVADLVAAGPEAGVLDARVCFDPSQGRLADSGEEALGYNRKTELFWFLDMECMERLGRMNAGHVALRREFLKAYGPGGEMEGGRACLWVETSILPADGVECEYIGCVDGTGLMGLEWAQE
ncbi:hem-containing dehydratase protein [Aspergillus avenaceus]|uniref:Hem-containing dehydratase protein n=1 Tax=Aspergillus avenaceus TaxID=36643 RepID=A0A5N6TPX8_ASPAV|nr:hem-containing dehydratase protein [Aspergillus avenaceus]